MPKVEQWFIDRIESLKETDRDYLEMRRYYACELAKKGCNDKTIEFALNALEHGFHLGSHAGAKETIGVFMEKEQEFMQQMPIAGKVARKIVEHMNK